MKSFAGDRKENTFLKKAFKGVLAVICPVVCMQVSLPSSLTSLHESICDIETRKDSRGFRLPFNYCSNDYRKGACTTLMAGKVCNM